MNFFEFFSQVNLELFERALKIKDLENISEEDFRIAQAAYYFELGDKNSLFELSRLEFSEPFNHAFTMYLLAKLESSDKKLLSVTLELLANVSEQEESKHLDHNLLLGLVNLFRSDLYSFFVSGHSSVELVAESLAASRRAQANIDASENAAYFGLAYVYKAQLMRGIYTNGRKDIEINRAEEVGRMFR